MPVSVLGNALGGALSITYVCDGCRLKGARLDTSYLEGNTTQISRAVQVAFILSGCTHATYYKTLRHALGINAVEPAAFMNTIKTMYPVVKTMVDETCEGAMTAMKQMDQTQLGSWSRAVTTADGTWMTRGYHSKNFTFSIRNYFTGALLSRLHLCQKGRDRIIDEPLYQGTSKAAEGYAAKIAFAQLQQLGMNVEINWQDADSSSSNAVREMFSDATIMTCGGYAARSHLKQLEVISGRKSFTKVLQNRHKKEYPDVEKVTCHCPDKHSPGCGCMSKAFMEQSRNNFSQILSESQSASEFSKRLRALHHHVRDEHEWKCDFHSTTVCSCGKCPDRDKPQCVGKPYNTRNRLTCPFHSLAYVIEIEHRAAMADSLVHPLLKRGHSNWPEASHNVLIRFRSKHGFLERLHYNLSTDLGLLQSNMSYERNAKGSEYRHWTTELYRRLKLPVYEGVGEALERYAKRRGKVLERKKKPETKRRRIGLKIARKREQTLRQEWSKRHGGDTYGDGDSEVKEGDRKQCRACGSFTHSRKTSKDCPYNKKKQTPPKDPTPDSKSDMSPSSDDAHSDDNTTTDDVTSDDDELFVFGNQMVTEQQCTCNTMFRAHKAGCPLNSRNRYRKNLTVVKDDDEKPNVQQKSDVWVKHSLYTLTNEDGETIREATGWLSDSVITASQFLIRQCFPNIAGLQPPVLQQTRGFKAHSGEFVQVINVENVHWCVVSNIGCTEGTVNVYDSMNWTPSDSSIPIIASLLSRRSLSKITINTMEVQKQVNRSNCGVLAIAMAYDLCAGLDPGTAKYNQKEIRHHLTTSLEEGTITRFPRRAESRKTAGIVSSLDVDLHCTCRMPHEEDVDWAECDTCKNWFHKECMDIPDEVFAKDQDVHWECKSCKP